MDVEQDTMPRAQVAGDRKGRAAATPRVSWAGMAWPIVLSLVVFGVVTYLTYDPRAFHLIGRRLNGWLLLAAIGTVLARVGFGAWRLDYLAAGRMGFRGGLRIQLIWDFLAYVTPSTVGGGPFVPVVVARERPIPLGEATSIMLFAMLLDQLGFVLTMPVILVSMHYLEVIPGVLGDVGYWSIVLFFAGFTVWVLLFGYGTLFRPRLLSKVVNAVFGIRWLRRFRRRAVGVMGDFQDQARMFRSRSAGFYAKAFVLSFLPWLSRYALMVFIVWSVYPMVDKLLALLRAAALNLSSVALPTPGGAGGVEALYVAFFGPPLVPGSLVAPTLLAWRLLSYYLFIVVGSFFAMRHLQR